ncbi:MAG: DUF4465 domain-containing protein [Myxococcota bacterium]
MLIRLLFPSDPQRTARRALTLTGLVVGLTALVSTQAAALTATFEDLGLDPTPPGEFLDPPTSGGSFVSGGVTFLNDGGFGGFSASTTSDTTTPGFTNQYSNITGEGAGGSDAFGIASAFSPVELAFPSTQTVLSAEFVNTTYATLSMLNGDSFAKQFGGPTGDDEDFFLLTIEGLDGIGGTTGSLDFYLADYRFADNSLDYIVTDWTTVDLTVLGAVNGLRFSLTGSDVGAFGLNTPAYFAIDDLVTVPEPGTALLVGLGLAGLAGRSRRTRK